MIVYVAGSVYDSKRVPIVLVDKEQNLVNVVYSGDKYSTEEINLYTKAIRTKVQDKEGLIDYTEFVKCPVCKMYMKPFYFSDKIGNGKLMDCYNCDHIIEFFVDELLFVLQEDIDRLIKEKRWAKRCSHLDKLFE